ncbi:MAG: hypothetical protein ACXVAY_12985 [Mucilaginibacter sp.]
MNSKKLLYFEKLKYLVIQSIDTKQMLPSDCKLLSASIFKATGKSISETTLKRLFGFARSNFKPSGFTLNTLSQFCGFDNWEAFCNIAVPVAESVSSENDSWTTIRQQAHKITGYTLQALKNRSGVPYQQTVRRDFLSVHMQSFFQSGMPGTIIMAPAGYGKTIALCHWVEEQIAPDGQESEDHIILFFSSSALVNGSVSKRNLNDWLLSILGTETSLNLAGMIERDEKRFILVIDGFDDALLKSHWFHLLMNELTDILSLHKASSHFKIVLTMRSATWVNYQHMLRDPQHNWFIGDTVNGNCTVNVPLFGLEEMNTLGEKNHFENNYFLHVESAATITYPLYFQFFYQARAGKPAIELPEQIDIRELLLPYILNKVFKGALFTEKLLLVRGLIEQLVFFNEQYAINKLPVNRLLKQHPLAYRDLLSMGYLNELNTGKHLHTGIEIAFGNSDFFEHAIAYVALSRHQHLFNEALLTTLLNLPVNRRHKLSILKWCYLHTIKNEDHLDLKYLLAFDFSPAEKSDLFSFIRRVDKKAFRDQIDTTEKLFAGDQFLQILEYQDINGPAGHC